MTLSASASSVSAHASAFIDGNTVAAVDAHPTTAYAQIDQSLPLASGSALASATAYGVPGGLHATGSASTSAGHSVQGQAGANWGDAFSILSPGYAHYATGFFSGTVQVSGELMTALNGRGYADTQIFSDASVGGHFEHGEARHLTGYDIGDRTTGTQDYALPFTNIPFVFGESIDVAFGLLVSADFNAIDDGASGMALADYSHTMIWGGITEVRDASGSLVTDYTAISPTSGFDFGPRIIPPIDVPEPPVEALLMMGLFAFLTSMPRPRSP